MTLTVDIRHRLGTFSIEASFRADAGVTALFGRSGSGKTSLIKIIAGLIRPEHGRIVFDDTILFDAERGTFVPCHRRRFGYVFQEPRLFPHLTVRQNLAYGCWFAPQSTGDPGFDRIVEMLDIGALLLRRPGKLSGGEKQRVAIGRALLSAPRLLLMDEPLSSLDEERKAEILPYLERLRDDATIPIIYVSHSIGEVARLANHVLLVDKGRIDASGPAAEILSEPSSAESRDRLDAGAVLEGRVESISQEDRLTVVALRTARLYLPFISGDVGKTVRVHIPARDVMLATHEPQELSALNILKGTISKIAGAADGSVEVQVDCGGDAVLARITRLSCDRLKLKVGKPVYAIIKTVALHG